MLRRLDRYIVTSIFALTSVVGLGLVALYSFIGFVGELDQGGDKSVSAGRLLLYTLVMTPSGLYALMPLIAMLGTLLGVGSLAAQSELTAMRAAGYSNLRIGGASLIAGVLLGLLGVVLGESVVPVTEQFAEHIKHPAGAGVRSKPIWLRDGDNIFFIRSLMAENSFADAEIYTFDDSLKLVAAMHVDGALFDKGTWQLSGVARTEFSDTGTRVVEETTRSISGGLSPEVLKLYVLEADTVSVRGLLRLIHYLEDNGLDSGSQRLELWRKLIAPLTIMGMVVFAVPFVFGPTRGGGAGQRLLLGILVGVTFHLLNEVSANLGNLYGWSAPVAAGVPTAALMVLAVVRLVRARLGRCESEGLGEPPDTSR